jgi:hypothetical protein
MILIPLSVHNNYLDGSQMILHACSHLFFTPILSPPLGGASIAAACSLDGAGREPCVVLACRSSND